MKLNLFHLFLSVTLCNLFLVSCFGTTVTFDNNSSSPWSYTFGWLEYNSGGGLSWDVNTPTFELEVLGNQSTTVTWPTEAVAVGIENGGSLSAIGGYGTSGGGYILPQPSITINLGQGQGDTNNICFTNYTWNVVNTASTRICYYVQDTTTGVHTGFSCLDSGASGLLSLTAACGDSVGLFQWDGTISEEGTNVMFGGTLLPNPPSSALPSDSPSNPADSSSPPQTIGTTSLPQNVAQYNPTNVLTSGTNSPILYTSTNQTTVIQQGDSALYTAVVNGFNQSHSDSESLSSELSTGFDALVSAVHGIGSSTNASVYDTNGAYSVSVLTNLLILDSGTASSQAASAMSSVSSSLDSAVSDLGSVDDGSSIGSGSAMDVVIPAGGGLQFEISPSASSLSPIFSLALQIWTWVLTGAYILKVVLDLDSMYTRVILVGLKVPDLEVDVAGTGGNIAGVTLVMITAFSFMALWAAMCGSIAIGLTGSLSFGSMSSALHSSPVSGMAADALGLLSSCFPISLSVGLFVAYLVWRLSVVKITVLAMAAMKLLPQ